MFVGHLHSRHHRLYVPYAFGALYNHPIEGFFLDTLGACIAFKAAMMTTRQGMIFFTASTMKTVDDHCGYALPWDPLQYVSENNAAYHDIHHQSWGIKTNFSQPFFTVWDHMLGTIWSGGSVSARYERSRNMAEKLAGQNGSLQTPRKSVSGHGPERALDKDITPYGSALKNRKLDDQMESALKPSIPAGKATAQAIGSRDQVLQDTEGGGVSVLADEDAEEREAEKELRRSPRKRVSTQKSTSGDFQGLRDRVSGVHGKAGVLGMDGGR